MELAFRNRAKSTRPINGPSLDVENIDFDFDVPDPNLVNRMAMSFNSARSPMAQKMQLKNIIMHEETPTPKKDHELAFFPPGDL